MRVYTTKTKVHKASSSIVVVPDEVERWEIVELVGMLIAAVEVRESVSQFPPARSRPKKKVWAKGHAELQAPG